MNKQRRETLFKAKKMLKDIQDAVDKVKTEEEMAFDNLSEGLQQTMRGESMENNIDVLEEIVSQIDDIIDLMDEIE